MKEGKIVLNGTSKTLQALISMIDSKGVMSIQFTEPIVVPGGW